MQETIDYFVNAINFAKSEEENFAHHVNQLRLLIETSSSLEEKIKLLALAYSAKKAYEERFVKKFAFVANARKTVAEAIGMNALTFAENPKIKLRPYTGEENLTATSVTEGYATVLDFGLFLNWFKEKNPDVKTPESSCFLLISNKEMLNALVCDQMLNNVVEIPGIKISPVVNLRFYFSKD